MKFVSKLFSVLLYLLVYGNAMSVDDRDTFFVTEGDSVTLQYYIRETQEVQETVIFHEDTRHLISRCIHFSCIFGSQEFRDRLKVYENGSLTITNTTVKDSGDYDIVTSFGSPIHHRILYYSTLVVRGFFSFDKDGVSVMEGDSVTLHTGVQMNQEEKISFRMKPKEKIRWYFNQTEITRIRYICTDVQCNEDAERFRDRLKLDHQTGSLTITDIRTTDSGLYDLLISWVRSSSSNTKIFIVAVHGVSDAERDEMKRKSVKEGESVTLDTRVIKNPHHSITWYFNDIRIALILGYQSKICTDAQCEERFRDRLQLDHQTGSLIITDTRTTDSGLYKLQIRSRRFTIMRSFSVSAASFLSFDTNGVSVMEGDSVTLRTGVQMKQKQKIIVRMKLKEMIRWYFNQTGIARIRYICTDVQCNEDTERFTDRLKLDHQTGSLTITNTRTTDSGLYKLQINSVHHRSMWRRRSNTKIFIVAVHGVSAAERHKMKTKSVKEGESVTLDTRVIKNPHHSITWYFNGTLIAVITRDQSKICTDVQCKERFRDRLQLDHQTGSLTITNTRTTDSGLYKLQIRSSRFTIMRSFSVSAASLVLVSKKNGDSLTLHTGVKTNQQEKIRWYFNDILIAEITGNLSKNCTNVRCKERFKDRLKLDKFGSLVIMNITTEDAGEYKLQISGSLVKIFCVSVASKRC
uniref:Ig-like domain-containing protein n=1 Tax=Cyprinus carpio TaxID=7962 RepID=A0A8C1TBS3_CYPCA